MRGKIFGKTLRLTDSQFAELKEELALA